MNTVKVAVLRTETDRLFRLANSHYHACVGVREVQGWQEVANRVLDESALLSCKRATVYDLDQWTSAVQALKDRLAASVERLAQLQAKDVKPSQRPILRVVSPCENYSQNDRIH